jgi:hypothetical protein
MTKMKESKKAKNDLLTEKVCGSRGNEQELSEETATIEETAATTDAVNEAENLEHTRENVETMTASCCISDGEEVDTEVNEVWDLKKIMAVAAITNECPIKCSHEDCALVAATVWVSNNKPSENWYSCLDCQVR